MVHAVQDHNMFCSSISLLAHFVTSKRLQPPHSPSKGLVEMPIPVY